MRKNQHNDPIQKRGNWKLYKNLNGNYRVEDPNGNVEQFSTKSKAKRHMTNGILKEGERPRRRTKKTVVKRVKPKQRQTKPLELMNLTLLKGMKILDSDENKRIRLLHDFKNTNMYIAFDGSKNQGHSHSSLKVAEAFYRKLFRAY